MKKFLSTYGLPMAAGLAAAISFPSFHLYPLIWVALIPLFWRFGRQTAGVHFLQFTLAGWVFYSVIMSCLISNIYWAGGVAIVGQQFLCAGLALFWGLFALCLRWVRGRSPWLGGALFAGLLWAAMEHLQRTILPGFGVGSLGYSQGKDLAFIQLASIGGTSLLSLFIVTVNVLLAKALSESPRRMTRAAAAVALILIVHAAGYALLDEADYDTKPLKVGLIQSNFPVEMKWDHEYTEEMVRLTIQKSEGLVEHTSPDLIVWPEALIMGSIDDPYVHDAVTSFSIRTGVALFTGAARRDYDPYRAYNSSYLIDKLGQIEGPYDKIHLAPFGEYVPFVRFLPFLRQAVPAIGGLSPGKETKIFSVEGRRFAPLICFEVLFPDVCQALLKEGADFLVVITNLGWFGASNALPQELEAARIRAIETRLPLVHCANTGISGVFDPWGRFSLIDGSVDRFGNFLELRDNVAPSETIRQRLAGTFPLAAPGRRLTPGGPYFVPRAFVLLALAVLVAAWVLGRTRRKSDPGAPV